MLYLMLLVVSAWEPELERFRSLAGNTRACFARQQNYTVVHEGRCIFVCVLPGFVRVQFGFLMFFV